jgi:hypothetical protein
MGEIEVNRHECNSAKDNPDARQKGEIGASENHTKYDNHIHYLRLVSRFPGAKWVIE